MKRLTYPLPPFGPQEPGYLLCLPLSCDSPVSTFVAHVDGMERSSDQVIKKVLRGCGVLGARVRVRKAPLKPGN